jgi:hypothetical protein
MEDKTTKTKAVSEPDQTENEPKQSGYKMVDYNTLDLGENAVDDGDD